MFCLLLHFVRSVLVRNSVISSSDSRERHHFFKFTPVKKQLAGRAWKRGWSMIYMYCPSCLVSRLIYHRSTSFPNITSNQWYISLIFQFFFSTAVGYEELSRSKTAKYFQWMLIINNDWHKKSQKDKRWIHVQSSCKANNRTYTIN